MVGGCCLFYLSTFADIPKRFYPPLNFRMESCSLIHLKRNGAEGISYPLIVDSSLILGR